MKTPLKTISYRVHIIKALDCNEQIKNKGKQKENTIGPELIFHIIESFWSFERFHVEQRNNCERDSKGKVP